MITLIVSVCGAPGAGKSSFAHGLMYRLKVSGISCELSSEYAKDLYYEESSEKLNNQLYVFGKQLHRLKRILGKVSVIVTDAPLIHSIHYAPAGSETFKKLVLEEHNKLNNYNIYLTRKHEYNPQGRFQDESGATEIHNSIEKIMIDCNIPFHRFDATEENLKIAAEDIIKELTNLQ